MKYFFTDEDIAILEKIIQDGNRAEIVPTKDGIKIFEHKRIQRK